MKVFQRVIISRSGMTLVEIVTVMAISSIVFTGVIVAYSSGIGHWQDTSEEMVLYNEGTMALSLMGRFIRNANFIRIRPFSGLPEARMDLDYPEDIGSAAFYFVRGDGSFRWNNQVQGNNKFNLTLLPAVEYRQQRNETPYLTVNRVRFIPLDDLGVQSPTLTGYSLIRIELTLEDSRGNTVQLSSVVSKRN